MFKDQLFSYRQTYITLDELEVRSKAKTYGQFAKEVLALEDEGVLHRVKKAGENGKFPSLAYKYKIQKGKNK